MKARKSINLNNKRTYIFLQFALALFIFLCFRAGIDNFFAGDDFDWCSDALKVMYHPSYISKPQAHYFMRPMETLYFLVNLLLINSNPMSYHLTSILIHILNVVLISYFFSLFCNNRLAGLLGALFWGLNYKHVEVVFRPTAVADSLVLLFWLGAFFLFMSHRRILTVIFLILGIFSKENALVFPLLVTLYVFWFIENEKRIWIKRTILLWIPSFLYVGFRPYITGGKISYFTVDKRVLSRFWEIMLSQVGPDSVYIKQVWLVGKSYLLPGWIAGILFVILGIAVWKLPRVYRFGLLWMCVTMLPTVFITHQTSRYYYIPLVGLGIIVGQGVSEILVYFWKKRAQKAILGICTAFILVIVYFVVGVNLEEQDYAFFGEIHRQAAESFKQNILPQMPREPHLIAVFPKQKSEKWIGELFERNLLKPWYLPSTYKWVFVRPHAVLGLTNTWSFVSYCIYNNNDVKDTLFVKVSYEEFRKGLLSGDFYIIMHDEETNTFEFSPDTLKTQLVEHINDKNFYSFLQPGSFSR